MKNNRDQLNEAFHSLRDDTVAEAMAAMETPVTSKALRMRRRLTVIAACLAAALMMGGMLALPFLTAEDPAPPATEPQNPTDIPPAAENGPAYHEVSIVRLMNLSASRDPEEEDKNISLGMGEDIRVAHEYYFMFQSLEEGETLTVSSRYAALAQAKYGTIPNPDEDTIHILPGNYIQAETSYQKTLSYDPSLTENCLPTFLWSYWSISEEGRTEGNIYEDYVDFIIRNEKGEITGVGSIYLVDQKVMSKEENNPYFKMFSISRGKVLGSVRFDSPADVTEEQVDTLLLELHGKAQCLSAELLDPSTFTADEMLIKNWATILETDYPEYLSENASDLVLRGMGGVMEGIRAIHFMAEPETYWELRTVFFFDDGTYAIAEYGNVKCICPTCGEIEFLEHPFFTQVHNVSDYAETYRHMKDTYWLFYLNDGRTLKVSMVDGTYSFISEPDTAV